MPLKFCSLILFLHETENPLLLELLISATYGHCLPVRLCNCFAYIPYKNLPCDVRFTSYFSLRRKTETYVHKELKVLKQDFYHRCVCFHVCICQKALFRDGFIAAIALSEKSKPKPNK